MLRVFLNAHFPAVKNGVVDLLSDLFLEPPLDGKKSSRILAAKTVEQILTEISERQLAYQSSASEMGLPIRH